MIHIIPNNDLKEHDESTMCECNPRIEYEGEEILVIHNAYDLREIIENVNEILEKK